MEKKIITNQFGLVIFMITSTLNMKVMLIEIKKYQLKNILMKLDHT